MYVNFPFYLFQVAYFLSSMENRVGLSINRSTVCIINSLVTLFMSLLKLSKKCLLFTRRHFFIHCINSLFYSHQKDDPSFTSLISSETDNQNDCSTSFNLL